MPFPLPAWSYLAKDEKLATSPVCNSLCHNTQQSDAPCLVCSARRTFCIVWGVYSCCLLLNLRGKWNAHKDDQMWQYSVQDAGLGCELWQFKLFHEDSPYTRASGQSHFVISVSPALTIHIRVWNISGKLLSILNVDALFVLSVYSRRMLGKQLEVSHNHFHFSECNPYLPADTALLCCSLRNSVVLHGISECASLQAIRISLVMSPPHLSNSPFLPPSKTPHLG